MKKYIGKDFKKLGTDYTAGRIGTVIKVNGQYGQLRIAWHTCPNGMSMKLETWVSWKSVIIY